MKAFHHFLFLLVGLGISCQSTSVAPSNEKKIESKGVVLYLVTTTVDLSSDATALEKVPLTLEKEPLIDYDQIDSYTVATHTFRVKDTAVDKFKGLSNNVPLAGKPFALVVDGEVIYTGLLWNPISSLNTAYPFIVLDKNVGNELAVEFRTPPPGGSTRIDPRNDTRLLDRLKEDDKLK